MKKKIYALISIMIIMAIIFAACNAGGNENTEEAVNTSGEPTIAEEVSSNLETESSTDDTKESSTTEKATEKTTEKATEKPTEKTTESTTKKQSTTQKQTTTEKKETTTKKTTTTQKQTTTQQYGSNWVKKGDEKAVAEKVIYYINKYRKEEGNVTAKTLSGLSNLCQYRSNQLLSNYAHDRNDIKKALNALNYGYYNGTYYDCPGQEAIGHMGRGDVYMTIDELAKSFADAFRNSWEHWRYVGAVQKADDFYNSEYIYIGCGISCSNNDWTCCIWVSDLDTDEMTRLQIEPNEFLDQIYGQN